MDNKNNSDWKKEWKDSGLDPDKPEDFKKIQDILAKKMEANILGSLENSVASKISKTINKLHGIDKQKPLVEGVDYHSATAEQAAAPALSQEFIDSMRQRSLDLLAKSKGIKEVTNTPIMSSVLKPNPKRIKSQQTQSVPQSEKQVTESKIEPKQLNNTTQPIQNIESGDSETDILNKMFSFMKEDYNWKNKKHEQDTSNKKKQMSDQARRSDELIGLFTGKKQKGGKKSKAEKFEKSDKTEKKKPTAEKEVTKTTTTPAVPTAIKVATGAAAVGGASLVGIDALAAKITKNEGGGNPNQANIVKGTARKEADIVKGNIDVTTGKAFDKSLEQMTLGEAYDLGIRRGQHYNAKGAGAAMGKYGFMPIAIKDRGMALYGNDWRSMPFDSKTQDELNKSLITNNLQKLQKAGIPPSERNLYLMHFFGNTNQTSAFLNSPDNAKMGPILDMYNEGATANPDVAKLTVGEYKSRFLAKFDNTTVNLEKPENKAVPITAPKPQIPEKIKSGNGENKSPVVVSNNNNNVYQGGTSYNVTTPIQNNNSPLLDVQYNN